MLNKLQPLLPTVTDMWSISLDDIITDSPMATNTSATDEDDDVRLHYTTKRGRKVQLGPHLHEHYNLLQYAINSELSPSGCIPFIQ
jgi:hypothetical protein